MKSIKANYHTLHVLKNAKPKLRRAILSEGGKELFNSIKEYVLNAVHLSEVQAEETKATLRRLADKRVRHSAKKRLLVQRGGFLLPLLSTVLPILASVIFRSQTS